MGRPYSLFDPGRAAEAFFLIPSSPGSDFTAAANEVLSRFESALSETGSSPAQAMMTRIYLRGGSRAREALHATDLFRKVSGGPVSIVGQDPLEGGPIALFSQHVVPAERFPADEVPAGKGAGPRPLGAGNASAPAGAFLQGNYGHLWLARSGCEDAGNVSAQTTACLGAWKRDLAAFGMDWAEHVLRTWFFIDDIDGNYAGMVKARLDFFSEHGLTPDRRYPASTGIGACWAGAGTGPGAGLGAELMAIKGLSEAQVRAMRDERNMPAAMSYGVSFERGIAVRYGDRLHCHVSGTASIGPQGGILHPGNAARQTEQALKNVENLLGAEGLGLSHLAYLLAYVRDPASAPRVRATLDRCLPATVPSLILEGAVCRPGWLVEVEGMALKAEPGPFRDFP